MWFIVIMAYSYNHQYGITPVFMSRSYDDASVQFDTLVDIERRGEYVPVPEPITVDHCVVAYPALARNVTILREEKIIGYGEKHIVMISLISVNVS